jgi:mannose-6-phosphate isomerase-like protein (cupin superfamily)
MARVFRQSEARRMSLPGRTALDIVSAATGAQSLTLRLVEILPSDPGSPARGSHQHDECEECIFVLSGTGRMSAAGLEHDVTAGDTILVPRGEKHVTRNTGASPLQLLCFFPIADIRGSTKEPAAPERPRTP